MTIYFFITNFTPLGVLFIIQQIHSKWPATALRYELTCREQRGLESNGACISCNRHGVRGLTCVPYSYTALCREREGVGASVKPRFVKAPCGGELASSYPKLGMHGHGAGWKPCTFRYTTLCCYTTPLYPCLLSDDRVACVRDEPFRTRLHRTYEGTLMPGAHRAGGQGPGPGRGAGRGFRYLPFGSALFFLNSPQRNTTMGCLSVIPR